MWETRKKIKKIKYLKLSNNDVNKIYLPSFTKGILWKGSGCVIGTNIVNNDFIATYHSTTKKIDDNNFEIKSFSTKYTYDVRKYNLFSSNGLDEQLLKGIRFEAISNSLYLIFCWVKGIESDPLYLNFDVVINGRKIKGITTTDNYAGAAKFATFNCLLKDYPSTDGKWEIKIVSTGSQTKGVFGQLLITSRFELENILQTFDLNTLFYEEGGE